MNDLIKEAIEAVTELNGDVEYIEGVSEEFSFNAITDGTSVCIDFLGSRIWSSEDDCREIDEDKGTEEPLDDFLRKERDKIIENLKLYHKKGYKKDES